MLFRICLLYERNYQVIFLEQLAFNTRLRNEKLISVVMEKCVNEENVSQPEQNINKQFKVTVTFLTRYIGIFNVTNKTINPFSQRHLVRKTVSFK